jgi:hypothetical protein
MTGPEHYQEAERLIGIARGAAALHGGGNRPLYFGSRPEIAWILAEAQVHATLALAAAPEPGFEEKPEPLEPVIPPDEFEKLRQMKRDNPLTKTSGRIHSAGRTLPPCQ